MKPIFEQERQFLNKTLKIELPTDCWRKSSKIYLDCTCEKPIYQFKVENGLMKITKNNEKLFNEYSQLKIPDLIEKYNHQILELEKKSIQKTIQYIKDHKNDKYVVGHSSGKDSTLMYAIWLKSLEKLQDEIQDINWGINFANTSNETADTFLYIKNELPRERLNILNPKIGFYQWIVNVKDYFIPSVMVRNCCSTYKEGQIDKYYDRKEKITMVLGMRKYESSKRSKYDYIMDYDYIEQVLKIKPKIPKTWIKFNPIVEWHDEEVWLYILKEGLKYNNQYNVGFNRCGCLICPYQSDYIDLLIEEHYPSQWNRWMVILEKNYEMYDVVNRLKWTLDEWKRGKWKQGTSKEQELIHKKATKERIKELADLKGISEHIAEKYFNKKCNCGKKLNSDEIAINFKIYGRNIDLSKLQCKKCFCESNNMSGKDYVKMVHEFRDSGCELF